MGIDIEVGRRCFDKTPRPVVHLDLMDEDDAQHLVVVREGDDYNTVNLYLTDSELADLYQQLGETVRKSSSDCSD